MVLDSKAGGLERRASYHGAKFMTAVDQVKDTLVCV